MRVVQYAIEATSASTLPYEPEHHGQVIVPPGEGKAPGMAAKRWGHEETIPPEGQVQGAAAPHRLNAVPVHAGDADTVVRGD
jgi:hypothetical protein